MIYSLLFLIIVVVVVLAGSEIQRHLVQLVAPEFPAILRMEVADNLILKEGMTKDFMLSEMVNLTCEDRDYWKAWCLAAGE